MRQSDLMLMRQSDLMLMFGQKMTASKHCMTHFDWVIFIKHIWNSLIRWYTQTLTVCRYLSCNAAEDELMTSAASFNALAAFCSPSAAITCIINITELLRLIFKSHGHICHNFDQWLLNRLLWRTAGFDDWYKLLTNYITMTQMLKFETATCKRRKIEC